ncbi:MAG: methyl-accepting chemotaxis protein, partial [Bdellovibrionota bacterium]
TTNEVSRVVQESNTAVEGIAGIVKEVASAAQESSVGANQTLEAAKGLGQLAERLNALVKKIEV